MGLLWSVSRFWVTARNRTPSETSSWMERMLSATLRPHRSSFQTSTASKRRARAPCRSRSSCGRLALAPLQPVSTYPAKNLPAAAGRVVAQLPELHLAALVRGTDAGVKGNSHGPDMSDSVLAQSQGLTIQTFLGHSAFACGRAQEWRKGPSSTLSQTETPEAAKLAQTCGLRADVGRQQTAAETFTAERIGSPSATCKEHELLPRDRDACKYLVLHDFGKIPRRLSRAATRRIALWFLFGLELQARHKLMREAPSSQHQAVLCEERGCAVTTRTYTHAGKQLLHGTGVSVTP